MRAAVSAVRIRDTLTLIISCRDGEAARTILLTCKFCAGHATWKRHAGALDNTHEGAYLDIHGSRHRGEGPKAEGG